MTSRSRKVEYQSHKLHLRNPLRTVARNEGKKCQVVVSVSISSALARRFSRKSGQEWKKTSTDSFVELATKTTTTTATASFASKSTRTQARTKMMTTGLAVTTANDGYHKSDIESHRVLKEV